MNDNRKLISGFLLLIFVVLVSPSHASGAKATGMKDLFDFANVDVKPEAIEMNNPVFPEALHKAGISGSVLLAIIVTKEGTVGEIYIIKATHPEFGAAAQKAAATWRFRPAMRQGKIVNCRLALPINFDLKN